MYSTLPSLSLQNLVKRQFLDMKELKAKMAVNVQGSVKEGVYLYRKDMLDGLLPAVAAKIRELLTAAQKAGLSPVLEKGYDVDAGQDSFYAWGAACRVTCSNMAALKNLAEGLGITWLSDKGDMAYTKKLTIEDFKTSQVNGDLELIPGEKGVI